MEGFEFLSEYLTSGEVEYLNDSTIFFQMLVTNYPIGFYRIDWNQVKNKIEFYIGLNYPESIQPIKDCINKIILKCLINDDEFVYVCFDGITEGAFKMRWNTFKEYAHEILTTPQHTYVIPEDASWCLNYTSENYLYFGYANQ